MKPSIQKLQKFFKLEAERGYDNHAVWGGLERMLDLWEGEARVDGLPEDLIQLVISRIRDYGRLTEKSRAETLQGLWKRIQRGEDVGSVEGLQTEAPAQPAVSQTPAKESPVEPAGLAEEVPGEESDDLSWLEQQAAALTTRPKEAQGELPRVVEERPPQPAVRVQPRRTRGSAAGWQTASEPPALNAPLTVLEGIGPRTAEVLGKLGLITLRDLLYFFPRSYDDYTRLKPINRLEYGEEVTVIGTVQSINSRPLRNGKMTLIEAVISDGTGALRVNWFNQTYIARRLHPGMHISLAGKVEQYLGRPVMTAPSFEPIDQQALNTNRIVPVYPLTAGLTHKWMRTITMRVVTHWAPRLPDPLPAATRQAADLIDLPTALLQVHFPDSWDDLKGAQERLAFDEIFMLQLGVMQQKRSWKNRSGRIFPIDGEWLEHQVRRLPFPLTGAQGRALQDIQQDFQSGQPMNRLVQGDVGSGKTLVAALAALMVIRQGAQVAIMAPTSILAEQHYKNLLRLLTENIQKPAALPVTEHIQQSAAQSVEEVPVSENGLVESFDLEPRQVEGLEDSQEQTASIEETELAEPETASAVAFSLPDIEPPLRSDQIRLLVGSTSETEKREIREQLADGSIKLIIGTHALIEDPVVFQDLQLVIVDEQHRFGVEQRAALRAKGDNPHLLVMTATPIPRSLALTIYGDLDVTVIDELPPGRKPVETYVLMPRERERAYTLIRSQVQAGHQAFIIYPLIEESDSSDAKAAVAEQARLQKEVFRKLKVGLLHGRMPPDEKDAVMEAFRQGEYHILVSTTVIEVGVDIPNATVMLIEGANRFGLAQLHQLRGRVGRGAERSFCLLIPENPDEAENERLQVMAATNDGFILAERDLEQRGPGQFLGTRQAGYAELQLANLTDVRLIDKARRQAQAIFEKDPELSLPEHALLASAVQHAWGGKGDIS